MVAFNLKFVKKQVYGQLVIGMMVSFAIIMMCLLWMTWMERFSGNANFFYFQTIVYNVVLIQAFLFEFEELTDY